MIKEWNLLRTIACLTIVFLHSTTHIGRELHLDYEGYQAFRVMLTFATPTFVVLSEIILANRYQHHIPERFFRKRMKYILFPFVVFAIIDAMVLQFVTPEGINMTKQLIDNLTGLYEGYFILIIFQFYVLHFVIVRYNIAVEKLVPISIVIMILHLHYMYSDLPFVVEYRQYLKLPFTAWFGYFTIAYLIGKNYEKVGQFAKRYKWTLLLLSGFAGYFVYVSYGSGNTVISSRRIDLFPLVLTISFCIIGFGKSLPNFKFVRLISNYSLGIYLLHWQLQIILTPLIADTFPSAKTSIIVLFIVSLGLSIFIIRIISFLPFGSYIVGKTKRT